MIGPLKSKESHLGSFFSSVRDMVAWMRAFSQQLQTVHGNQVNGIKFLLQKTTPHLLFNLKKRAAVQHRDTCNTTHFSTNEPNNHLNEKFQK
jgi:hypothetical protein